MFETADALRVDLFGLSDHFCVYPDGHFPDWSMRPDRIAEYLRQIRQLGRDSGPDVVVGLEFDWFEAPHPSLAGIIANTDLDFRLGSVHHVAGEQFDMDPTYWSKKNEDERDDVFRQYWKLIEQMAESRLFDIAAHLDLPKKFGFEPSQRIGAEIETALDAIRENGLIVELNTAGFLKPCQDGYPSIELLQKCRVREIPVTLSSDAHIPEHLCFEFERGAKILAEAGYSQIARIRGREIWFEPLA